MCFKGDNFSNILIFKQKHGNVKYHNLKMHKSQLKIKILNESTDNFLS